MRDFARSTGLAGLALSAVLFASSPLFAETVKLAATLDGAQQ